MFVYILHSQSNPKKHYVGLTEDVETRLKQHNYGQVSHTSKYRPWELLVSIFFADKEKATRFEKYLKSGSGRAFSKKHF